MIQRFVDALLKREHRGFRVAHHEVIPARPAVYHAPASPLNDSTGAFIASCGIPRLYSHQAQAIDSIRSGRNTIIATPTSSGKSLIYNTVITEAILADPDLCALYLFPIKALTRDQLTSVSCMLESCRPQSSGPCFHAAVYDGDTTPYERSKIRQHQPEILLTNPDMLHYALLPWHAKWEDFWRKLRFVVLDEMHAYRGVFGSHLGQVFRRMRRICKHYGSSPQFILLSATIANPSNLAAQLTGIPESGFEILRDNGAPRARRHFLFLDPEEAGLMPASGVAARLVVRAAAAGLKTIAFTQSRRLTELVHMSITRMAPRLAKKVSSYRAGFLPEERRTIEGRLSSGELSAVISTSALEMGIDIGGLDLCILVGYPGTVMNTWQRGGRVGRSGQDSAIVLIPQPDALDHYIVNHPQEFLGSGYEMAVADPHNLEILKAHMPCAAVELPITPEEIPPGNSPERKALEELSRKGKLLLSGDGRSWLCPSARPHRHVDIRSIGASYAIFLNPEDGADRPLPLGKNDGIRALKECHPGAIYLHRGQTYQIEKLDLERRVIHASPAQAPYFTRVKTEKDTEILEVIASKPVANFLVRLGRLRVTEHILAYEKRRLFTQELLSTNDLQLPPHIFETVGMWLEIEPEVTRAIADAKLHFMGGIHAVEHAAISMFPLFALCDRNDIGGISSPLHPQVGKGAVFIYDGYPGGIGLAVRGYEVVEELLAKTLTLISSCECEEGCPRCIHSPKCGSGNKPLDKRAATAVLEYLLGIKNLPALEVSESTECPVEVAPLPPEIKQASLPRIGFLDIETQRLASEVGGWHNKHLMRVSVAILFETPENEFKVYRESDIPSLVDRMRELDLVVGFNIASFDYGVLKAYSTVDFKTIPTFDLLEELHRSLGYRLSLAHLAEKTLGKPKSSDGIQAVKWFREQNWESLTEYCKLDVDLTRGLFQHAIEKGYLLFSDKQNRVMRFPTPWKIDDILEKKRGEQPSVLNFPPPLPRV